MDVPEMFSDHGMFMFLYALMEMAASVSNIICIAQITREFVNYTLLVDFFNNFKGVTEGQNWHLSKTY